MAEKSGEELEEGEKQHAIQWLQDREIPSIFNSLAFLLIHERPKSPLEAMEKWIQEERQRKGKIDKQQINKGAEETVESFEHQKEENAEGKEEEVIAVEKMRRNEGRQVRRTEEEFLPRGNEGEEDEEDEQQGEETQDVEKTRPLPNELETMFPSPIGLYHYNSQQKGRSGHYATVYRGRKIQGSSSQLPSSSSAFEGIIDENKELVVAIKVIPIQANWVLDEVEAMKCFQENDARKSSRVVQLRECCYHQEQDALWLVMDWVDGGTLEDLVGLRWKKCVPAAEGEEGEEEETPQRAAFSVQEIAFILHEILLGLEEFHGKGHKVHLDIKPANLLLRPLPSKPEQEEEQVVTTPQKNFISSPALAAHVHIPSPPHFNVVIADLGTSQEIGEGCQQLGDFQYMAPEIYGGYGYYTPASDVWPLACLAVYLCDGYSPWTDEPERVFNFMEKNYVAPVPEHVSAWPMELVHFIALCSERDPESRPQPAELRKHALFGKYGALLQS